METGPSVSTGWTKRRQSQLPMLLPRASSVIAIILVLGALPLGRGAESVSLESPAGQVRARFSVDEAGALNQLIEFDGRVVIERARIGVTVDGIDLGTGVVLGAATYGTINEAYPQLGGKSRALNRGNTLSLMLEHHGSSLRLEARAYDDGFAWRLIVPGSGRRKINGEASTWSLPRGCQVWFAERNSAWKLKTYAGEWISGDLEAMPTISKQGPVQGPPLVVELPARSGYVLLTEAALTHYSGLRLRAIGRRAFQADFTEGKAGFTVDGEILTPWRVVILARDLNALVNSDLVSNLNPAPDPELFSDPSFIKPGRSVWRWWSKGTGTPAEERQFVDYAAELGFEYSMIDAGWSDWKQPWEEIRRLADYAKARRIGLIIWSDVKFLREPDDHWKALRQFLDQARDAGVAAVKLDNINAETRANIDFETAASRLAAERRLMVIFHGVQKPTGERRTFPNEITREGIRGLELNKLMTETVIPPSHNAALPFTRFAIGPGDYTPLGYSRPGATTWAHQLATLIQFTSPIQVIGEHPEMLLHDAATRPALDVLKAIPSVWDETRVLAPSQIGKLALVARRTGDQWFLSGLAGGSPIELTAVDLSFLGPDRFRMVQLTSPQPREFVRVERPGVTFDTPLSFSLAAGDGFVCWLSREPPVAGNESFTPDGMKIQTLWQAPRPQGTVVGVGFPLLESARHATVFAPSASEGGYNHHAELAWHAGKLFAMWSNHPFTEDGGGQRVLFSSSATPEVWPPAREIFPAPGPVEQKSDPGAPRGIYASSFAWLEQDGRLFAIAAVNTAGPLAREVLSTGELGPIFRLWAREAPLLFPTLPAGDATIAPLAALLNARIGSPSCWPWWDFWDHFPEPDARNGRKLIEPTVHRARDGRWVMLLRDTGWGSIGSSNRVFVSVSPDGRHWPSALPTDIPDTPSRRDTVELDDGTVLLLGNQVATAFDNVKRPAYPRDPLTVAVSRDGYHFDRAYALRWNLPKTMRIAGVTGRGRGAQYPSGIARGGVLYVLYTVGKEDVGLSWVPLKALGLE